MEIVERKQRSLRACLRKYDENEPPRLYFASDERKERKVALEVTGPRPERSKGRKQRLEKEEMTIARMPSPVTYFGQFIEMKQNKYWHQLQIRKPVNSSEKLCCILDFLKFTIM